MKFLFLGAGAIGTYIGVSLAVAGHQVRFVEQPEPAEKLRSDGLSLEIDRRVARIHPDAVYTSISEALQASSSDVMVFALKSFDTSVVVDSLLPHRGSLPPALCLQNGVENEPELERAFGTGNVIAGTVTSAIGRKDVGSAILERKRGVGISLEHSMGTQLAQSFDQAGLRAKGFRRGAEMKWSKLLTNLVSNCASAILEMPPGEVYAHPLLFHIERAMLRECLHVMRSMGLQPVDLPGTPVKLLAFAIDSLPECLSRPMLARVIGGSRGNKWPSFYLDLKSGRGKTEVDWLNGAVARFGARHQTAAPVNTALTELLSALASGKADRSAFIRKPNALKRWVAGYTSPSR